MITGRITSTAEAVIPPQSTPVSPPEKAAINTGRVRVALLVSTASTLSPAAKAAFPFQPEDVLAHGLRVIHYDWLVSAAKVETRVKRANVEMHGSNEWAIAPSHSANGHSMLLSNSHLEWGDMHTYFEVQLTAPGVTSYGAVWIGIPVLRQCFTDYVGWTQTTNNPNGADLYRLTAEQIAQ